MVEPRRYHCIGCRKRVTATSDDHYRKHDREKGTECARSKRDIPTWLLRRGPESGPETDTPVKGRDYADCPQCSASPVLDGATGYFTDHTREGETPTSPRVPCGMGGKPYTPEGAACETNTADQGAASPSAAAPGSAPRDDARPPSQPESSTNQSERMISEWAATAREIEDRKLPPSPESTTTQNGSPPRPSAPEAPPTAVNALADSARDTDPGPAPSTASVPQHPCHIAKDHGPHKWMHERRQAQCPGKPALESTASTAPAPATRPAAGAASASAAAPSRENGSRNELGVAAVERLSRKGAPTPPATPADSAAPTPVDALEAATREVQKVLPGATVEYDSTPIPFLAATPSDAAPSPAASPQGEPAAAAQAEPLFAQPGSPFSQPAKPPAAVPAVPMSLESERIAAGLKQLFFDYCNRTERSRQKTLGPSGIGTPCDRKIAMTLLDIPAVNPGWIDKWASFVGTCIHGGLAEVFEWANAGTGRYTTEMPLTFPSPSVPKGTGDLLDRTYASFLDHKSLSAYGVKKFQEEGPPLRHRIQVHTYAYGARLRGEAVDHVVIIGWPREGNSLNDLCVWTERYDPQIARDALARVDRIAAEVRDRDYFGVNGELKIAATFPVADDCKFCPFYAPGDAAMERGCNGRT